MQQQRQVETGRTVERKVINKITLVSSFVPLSRPAYILAQLNLPFMGLSPQVLLAFLRLLFLQTQTLNVEACLPFQGWRAGM